MRHNIPHAALAGVLAALVLGFPSQAMQSRTPIEVASLGPQVGEQVPDFSLPDQNGRGSRSRSRSSPTRTSTCTRRAPSRWATA